MVFIVNATQYYTLSVVLHSTHGLVQYFTSSANFSCIPFIGVQYCYVVVNSLEQYFVSKWSAS